MQKVFIPEMGHDYNFTGRKLLVSKEAYDKEFKRNQESRWGNTQYMYTNHEEVCRRLSIHKDLRI